MTQLITRRLGRTERQVTTLGLGGQASIQWPAEGVDPVAIIEKGTTRNQRSVIGKLNTITDLAKKNDVKPPAVIVIGEVAELGRRLAWFKKTKR